MQGDRNHLWLTRFQRRSTPAERLFCFAHAGGHSVAFRQWPGGLPDRIEVICVQLPGRANRLREPPIASMDELVSRLVSVLAPELERPFAFFGHSMGAVLAWAVARALAEHGHPMPSQLLLSGRRGPRVPHREPPLSGLSNPEFIATIMRRYGGIPHELLRHPDVMELLLPAMRADIAAIENFEPPRQTKLPIPIAAFGGIDDHMITRADMAAWSEETSREFRLRLFPGGHFYLEEQRAELLAEITDLLGARGDGCLARTAS